MIPPSLTSALADERQADLRSRAAAACCAPVRRAVALATRARGLVARLRADASRVQLGRVDACTTC